MKEGELYICAGLGEIKCECRNEILADCECELTPPVCCGNPITLVEKEKQIREKKSICLLLHQ